MKNTAQTKSTVWYYSEDDKYIHSHASWDMLDENTATFN